MICHNHLLLLLLLLPLIHSLMIISLLLLLLLFLELIFYLFIFLPELFILSFLLVSFFLKSFSRFNDLLELILEQLHIIFPDTVSFLHLRDFLIQIANHTASLSKNEAKDLRLVLWDRFESFQEHLLHAFYSVCSLDQAELLADFLRLKPFLFHLSARFREELTEIIIILLLLLWVI